MSLRRYDEEARVQERLAAAGIKMSLASLECMGSSEYPDDAVPVLLRELDEPYAEMTLETIARAIDTEAARPYWDELLARYKRGALPPDDIPNTGLLMGLAILMSQLATRADLEQLIELAGDRSRGMSRTWFFKLVIRWGGKRGIDVVRAQLDDPLTKVQASVDLKRTDSKHTAALKRLTKAVAQRPNPTLPRDADEWSTSLDSDDWRAFYKYLTKSLGGELAAPVGKAVSAVISTAPLDAEGSVRLTTDAGVIQIGWFIDDTDDVDVYVWGSPKVRELCDAWLDQALA